MIGPTKPGYRDFELPNVNGADVEAVREFLDDPTRRCEAPVGGLGKEGTCVPCFDDYLEAVREDEEINFHAIFNRFRRTEDTALMERSLQRVERDLADPNLDKVEFRFADLGPLMGRYTTFGPNEDPEDGGVSAWPTDNDVVMQVPVSLFGDFHLAREYNGRHHVGDIEGYTKRLEYAKSMNPDGTSWWDAFPCCGTTLGLILLSHASRFGTNEFRVLWCVAVNDLCHLMARSRFPDSMAKLVVPILRPRPELYLNDLLFLVEKLWYFVGERQCRTMIDDGIYEPWQPLCLGDFNRDSLRSISVVLGQHLSAWNPLYNESGPKTRYSFPKHGNSDVLARRDFLRVHARPPAPGPSVAVRAAQAAGLVLASLASLAIVVGVEVAVRRTVNESSGPVPYRRHSQCQRVQSFWTTLMFCVVVCFVLAFQNHSLECIVVVSFVCLGLFFVSELGVFVGNCFGHELVYDEVMFRWVSLISGAWSVLSVFCVSLYPVAVGSVLLSRFVSVAFSQIELVSFAHSLVIPLEEVPLTVNESGSEFEDSLRSLSLYMTTTQDETARRLINLLLHMVEIYRHRDVGTTVAHIMLFINNENDLGPAVRANLFSLIDRLRSLTVNEAITEEDFKVEPTSGQFAQPIVAILHEIFGMLSISVLLNKSGLCGEYAAIFQNVSAFLRRDVSLDNFLKRCLELVKTVVSAVVQCVKTKSLDPLFASDPWTLRRWVTVVGTLLNDSRVDATITWFSDVEFKNLRDTGVIDPFFERRLHVHEMIKAGHMLQEVGNDLGSRYAGRFETELGLYESYRRTRALLWSKVYEWENSRVNGAFRVQPFGIYLAGKPRTGKTTLSNAIFRNFSTVLDLDFTPDMVQEYVPGANFQDNAGPTKSYLFFDDADQAVVKSGDPSNVYADVIQLVNNKSTMIEAARAEDKGKNFARYQATIFATNKTDQPKLTAFINEPIAFWRRFPIKLTAMAKPEYADVEGGLDPAKVAANPETKDLVEFLIEEYCPQGNGVYYVKKKEKANRYDVMIAVRDAYSVWVKEQLELVTRLNASGVTCPVCRISVDDHVAGLCVQPDAPVVTVNESGVVVRGYAVPTSALLCGVVLMLLLSGSYALIAAGLAVTLLVTDDDYTRDAKAFCFVLLRMWLAKYVGILDGLRYRAIMAATGGPVADFETRLTVYENKVLANLTRLLPSLNSVLVGIAVVSVGAYGLSVRKGKTSNEFLFATGFADNQVGSNRFATIRQPPMHANTVDQSLSLAATLTSSDVQNMIRSRLWLMRGPGGVVHALVVCSNIVMFPVHVFSAEKTVPGRQQVLPPHVSERFRFTKPGEQTTVHDVALSADRLYRVPGRDLCLAWVPSIFPTEKDISKRFPVTSMSAATATFDEGWLCGFSGNEFTVKHLDGSNPPSYSRIVGHGGLPYIKYGDVTTDGDCGSIGIIRIKNAMFVGFTHVIKSPGIFQSASYGEELVQNEIAAGMHELRRRTGVRDVLVDTTQIDKEGLKANSTVNESGWDRKAVVIGPFPDKRSSYTAAVGWNPDCPFEPVGTIQGFHADRFKTGICKSRLHDHIRPLLAMRGMSTDYAPPDYSGAMVLAPDGEMRWIDPYTHALKSAVNGAADPTIVDLCVSDYLFGCEELLGIDRVRPLTKYEATMGIPGVVKPKNMKRSVGLPFKRQKKHHYRIREDEFDMDISLCEQSDFFVSQWMQGIIVPPFSNASAKQEVVTTKKLAVKKLRVFQTLGDGFNDACRRMASGINAFILAHPQFFECYGTVNVTGPAFDEFMSWKDQVDPDRERRIAGDYEGFDLRQPSEIKIGTANVKRRLAELGSFTPEEVEAVYCCSLSSQYSYLIVKGDVVARSNGTNSGNNSTLIDNSIDNSLALRYAYYSRMLRDGVTVGECRVRIAQGDVFRRHVRVGIVGDDNEGAVARERAWFNQLVIRDELAAIGMKYTSATKDRDLEEWTPFSEATFLRRTPWFDETCGRWKAALDRNSISRMLLFTKPSESDCSVVDQESDVVSTALREAFLHGREFFESFKNDLESAVKACEKPFPTIRWYTYDYLQSKFVEGKFEVWAGELVIPEDEVCVTINESGNIDSSMDLGPISEIDTTTGVNRSGQSSAPEMTGHSIVTEGPLASFFERAVLISTGSLTSTDVVRSRVFYLPDIMGLILADPAVAAKVRNFNLLRGDLEVTIEVVGNSNLFGMYVASAAPLKAGTLNVGPTFPIVENFNFANSFQGIHGLINVSQSDSVVLTLPYLSEFDYFATDAGVGDPGWVAMIHCLDPVTNATDPALNGTVYFNVYARFRNFELAVPFNEGKKTKHVVGQSKVPGPISATISKVKQVTDIVGMIPGAGAVAAVVGQGLSVAQSIADVFGFTKVQEESDPTPFRRLGFSNVATTDGVFSGQMVGLSGGNNVTIDSRLGGFGDDDVTFASLFTKQTMVGSFSWTPLQARQTCLGSIPVTPGFAISGSGLTGMQPMTCGSLGLPFLVWCGSMDYEVIISCSIYMRGSLQVVWSPDSVPPTSNVVGTASNQIMDISVDRSHVFSVKWASPYPALVHAVSPSVSPSYNSRNGFLHFMVNIPLSSPSAAGARVLVLGSGGDDLQFSIPRREIQSKTTREAFYFTNEGQLGDGTVETIATQLAGTSSPVNLAAVLGGEAVGSVRQLVQKFSYIVTVDPVATTPSFGVGGLRYRLPFIPKPPAPENGVFYETSAGTPLSGFGFTWAGYYTSFYAGVRGSTRVMGTVNQWPGASVAAGPAMLSAYFETSVTAVCEVNTSYPIGPIKDSILRPLRGLDTPGAFVSGPQILTEGFSFTFPNYDNVKFRNNYNGGGTSVSTNRTRWVTFDLIAGVPDVLTGGGLSPGMTFYQACGADVALIYFLRTWPIEYR